jgi:riboflavin kinase/FMN adenylyltransferase
VWITSSLTTAITPTAIALGNFDGVHLGHQAVIRSVVPLGAQGQTEPYVNLPPLPDVSLRGLSYRQRNQIGFSPSSQPAATPIPTVMTFFPHPQEFFSGRARALLTPLPEKAAQISRLGIGQLVLLPFDQSLANLSPEAFVETLLVKYLRVQHISVGIDFCFGKKRQGTVDDLKALAARYGVQVHIAPVVDLGADRISSSRIRQALGKHDLETVKALLGQALQPDGTNSAGTAAGADYGLSDGQPTSARPRSFCLKLGYTAPGCMGDPDPLSLAPAVMNLGMRPDGKGSCTHR